MYFEFIRHFSRSNSIDINPQVSINMNKNVKTLNSDTALQEKSTIQEALESLRL